MDSGLIQLRLDIIDLKSGLLGFIAKREGRQNKGCTELGSFPEYFAPLQYR